MLVQRIKTSLPLILAQHRECFDIPLSYGEMAEESSSGISTCSCDWLASLLSVELRVAKRRTEAYKGYCQSQLATCRDNNTFAPSSSTHTVTTAQATLCLFTHSFPDRQSLLMWTGPDQPAPYPPPCPSFLPSHEQGEDWVARAQSDAMESCAVARALSLLSRTPTPSIVVRRPRWLL